MYLEKLELKNFRSCVELSIPLHEHLTVLVGENNGGKSNLLEALRLLTHPSSGRIERYCEVEDLSKAAAENTFQISGTFAGLSPAQTGTLISWLFEDDGEKARLGLSAEVDLGEQRVKRLSYWAGKHDTPPEHGSREAIRHVYLPALRDAKYALASGNPTRKLALLRHLVPEDQRGELTEALKREGQHDALDAIGAAVSKELGDLTLGVRAQAADLGFSENEQLIDIARDLRFRLGDEGAPPKDISLSGLGFANLLYMATIVVELERAREADLTLFLVEEPEAHLHPHLQMSVLDFLQERARRIPSAAPGEPAGKIQVIVASHSPNLTSWVSSENLIALRTVADEGVKRTGAVPLSKLPLDKKSRRKVDRYLDVTRASLLFGGRCVLVEGVAEALLLPVIAKWECDKAIAEAQATGVSPEEKDRRIATAKARYKLFRGATFIPIEGVDFEPYVRMLLSPIDGVTLADHLVVVTDADGERGAASKAKLEGVTRDLGVRERLSVFLSSDTLEVDLHTSGNADLMKAAHHELHPRSGHKWNDLDTSSQEALASGVRYIFESTKKGDFAQEFAALIEKSLLPPKDGEDALPEFKPPQYLIDAIEAVCR
jgi:putative ATP-dependent endonuclease of OLD family